MDKALLDTDIFSEFLKGVDQNVYARASAYQAEFGRFTLSIITVIEVVKGHHKHQRPDRIQEFLEKIDLAEILTIDIAIAELAGRIEADLERSGQPIGRADPIIAATAIQHGLTLVTGNQTHFRRVQTLGYGLKLDNWRGQRKARGKRNPAV